MVFLDYTTVSGSAIGGTANIYTTPYKCIVTVETITASGVDAKVRYNLPSLIDGYIYTSDGGGGSAVLSSGKTITIDNISVILHIFRLPESP